MEGFMPTKRKPLEIRFTLDRTGSMAEWQNPVVEGVNAYLKKVQDDPLGKDALVTLVQFDSMGFDILRRAKAKDIEPLREDEYKPRALTPLFDATASALNDNIQPDIRYVAVLFTDGLENASTKYKTVEEIRALVEQRRSEGWIIIFLAANIDAWKVARDMGIPPETTMNVHVRGENQPQKPGLFSGMFGGGGSVSPVILALGAAAALGLAYAALRPGQAAAAPAFTDADRNAAMGVDGTSTTWQQAVEADVKAFDEPFNSVFDLPEDVQQAQALLPADFDPSLGSMGSDGTQLGGFNADETVANAEDVPANKDEPGDGADDSKPEAETSGNDTEDAQAVTETAEADADAGGDTGGDSGGGDGGGGD